MVVPSEEEDAGATGKPPAVDVCERPNPPEFCLDAGAPVPPSTCTASKPDGVCVPELEDCSCEDCREAARCNELCVDDGACDQAGGEDCSCGDCDGKAEGCTPPSIGCVTNGICSLLEDDCTCPDCREDEHCQKCADNGYCAAFLEGCSCADCSQEPLCLPAP